MPSGSSTTIKVQKTLRERISRAAAVEGRTAADLISRLLDDYERRQRFEAVREAYESADPGYLEESAVWDSLAGDGLDR